MWSPAVDGDGPLLAELLLGLVHLADEVYEALARLGNPLLIIIIIIVIIIIIMIIITCSGQSVNWNCLMVRLWPSRASVTCKEEIYLW